MREGVQVGYDAAYTILIVDDNVNNLYSLRTLIKSSINARVIEAKNGETALSELLRHNVDLIILDIYMNGMNGFELASIIKGRKKTKDIPIVFLTASYAGEEFKRMGFELGAVDYLVKPVDEYQFINRISTYLKLIEKERMMNIVLEQKVQEQTKELRKAKEEAEKAKEEAEKANEAKSMFFANISHELRTPLNILLSATQLIKTYLDRDIEGLKDKLQQKLNMQVQNCYRLLRLINNLIDITKMDTDNFKLTYARTDIVQVVEAITMSVSEYIESKGISLVFDTDVEEKNVDCDLDAIERIMLNLLSNAIKFTSNGGTVSVSINDFGEYIRISVKDTGIGIPEDKLPIIFERFKQADPLLTRKHEGSGIGLSLVKSFVEMHNGRIYVVSRQGEGSDFVVELPCVQNCSFEIHETPSIYSKDENVIRKIHAEFSDIYF